MVPDIFGQGDSRSSLLRPDPSGRGSPDGRRLARIGGKEEAFLMKENPSSDKHREDEQEALATASFAAGTGGLDEPGSVVAGPFGSPSGAAALIAITGGLHPGKETPPDEEEQGGENVARE